MSIQSVPPSPPVDEIGVRERCARFKTRSITTDAKRHGLHTVLSMIDLTTLEGADTPGKVNQLCTKALRLHDNLPDIPHVASVCVYPTLVKEARKALGRAKINVAAVATYFPSGQADLDLRLEETRRAVDYGADEIDMVISRGRLLAGDEAYVFDEIAATREACGKAHLKVILEVGELSTLDRVRRASDIAIHAGAHFIKTSTGKVQPAATLETTLVMLQAIRDHYFATGNMVGMKPAGGIADAKLALHYLVQLRETLGEDWMTPEWYRFGASRLANDVLRQLVKMDTGAYQSLDYFSMD